MLATAKNERIAREIINVFAKEKCTVEEASEILKYVANTSLFQKSTVQEVNSQLFIPCEREEKIENQKRFYV